MNNDSIIGRGPHSPYAKEAVGSHSAALLVDFDNVTLGIRSDIQQQLRLIMNSDVFRGKISVQRAYADWRRYPQYIVPLSEASFDLIFAPAFGASKKNATDIRLAIDAVELVFVRPEIGTYILLSGDSDFSSLVLKLKEYGKYVIGIGIIESASDLLIQNCDEYYSYSELTGFTRVSEEDEGSSRDPWGLVVEAIVRMKERNDVMRSDRLKQVMQELDSHFTEKTAGFNKFSRFVIEAAKRGLLVATKLQNGQYELELGRDANVQPAVEANLAGAPTGKTREPAGGSLNLSEAFNALKTVLRNTTTEGGDAVGSDTVREQLVELAGANPVFVGQRYNRMLRQAHDAELIELTKDGDGYRLRLTSRFRAEEQETLPPAAKPRVGRKAKPAGSAPETKAADDESESATPPRRTRTRPRKRTAKESEGGTGSDGRKAAEGGEADETERPARDKPAASGRQVGVQETASPGTATEPGTKNRHGSRGMGPRMRGRGRPQQEEVSRAPAERTRTPEAASKVNQDRAIPGDLASATQPPSVDAGTPGPTDGAGAVAKTAESRAPTTRTPEPKSPEPKAPAPKAPAANRPEADGGFLKRVSAVVQKAIRGENGADD